MGVFTDEEGHVCKLIQNTLDVLISAREKKK